MEKEIVSVLIRVEDTHILQAIMEMCAQDISINKLKSELTIKPNF